MVSETQKQPTEVFYTKLRSQACNFIIKETLAQVSSCEFCKFSRSNTSGRLLLETTPYDVLFDFYEVLILKGVFQQNILMFVLSN